MGDRTSRGEPEHVGEIMLRCLEAAQRERFYRPRHPFSHRRHRPKPHQTNQLAFKFTEPVRDFERPLVDIFP